MGSQVEKQIHRMRQAFAEMNYATMDQIIEHDHLINQLEIGMHDKVTLLISKQQPVATDLRKLIVALKVSSDLERVADLVVDIAKQSQRMKEQGLVSFKEKLETMFSIAEAMMHDALKAYEASDMLLAQKVAMQDDRVDDLYGKIIRELFQLDNSDVEIDQVTQLAFVGRYIERIADYATNLSEWVVYEVNGKHFDLN